MKRNKVTLVYGFDENEIKEIELMVKENHLHGIKIINETMAGLTVEEILRETEPKDSGKVLPAEKVIIFNDMSDEEIEKYVELLRKEFKPLPIMAVVTETSEKWTFEYLVEHLIEEREKFRASMK